MGAMLSSFLDKPITKKESTDESNNKFICGISSMQGWRESQEDAHNCILEYDRDAAFFAVYDGHGGSEVSQYCSLKLPQYIKDSDNYKNGKIEDALVDCFLSFDQIFKTTEFADELNKLQPSKDTDDDDDDDEDENDDNNSVVEENIDNLYKEASMPIEEVIEKYTTESLNTKKDDNTNENDSVDTSGCCSSSSSSSKASTSQNSTTETNSDGVSSSSESKIISNDQCNNEKLQIETKNYIPDSSDMKQEISTQNGNNDDKQNSEAVAKIDGDDDDDDENESKNGEISKKDKGKNVLKPEQILRKSLRQKAAQIYKQFLENGSDEDDDDDTDSDSDSDEESFEDPTVESSEDEGVNKTVETAESSEEIQDDDDEDENEEDSDDDDDFRRYKAGYNSGCTAVVALLKGNELYVANIGDSRCVVCRNGEIIEMSFDHKPTDEPEFERITKAGGHVFDERVEGGLNLSRAFGDHSYKKNKKLTDREQMITALPDIKKLTLKPNEDEFIFLACDGIWNSMTTEECIDFLRTRLQINREKLSEICEEMFDSCLATDPCCDSKGNDNMTAVLIKLKWNIPKRASSPSHTESDAKRVKTDDSNNIPQIDTTV